MKEALHEVTALENEYQSLVLENTDELSKRVLCIYLIKRKFDGSI